LEFNSVTKININHCSHRNVKKPTKLSGFVAKVAGLGVLHIALLSWDPKHSIISINIIAKMTIFSTVTTLSQR